MMRKLIQSYTLDSLRVDWYEVDPEIYWQSVVEGLNEVVWNCWVDQKLVKSISGCSQGETLVLLDDRDRPNRSGVVWLDKRMSTEVDELRSSIGDEEFFNVTGISEINTTWSALKLLWLKKNESDAYSRIKKYYAYSISSAYIVFTLTNITKEHCIMQQCPINLVEFQ